MRLIVGVFLLMSSAMTIGAEVSSVRTWASPESTRIVFDVNGPVRYKLFQIANPQRIVLDVFNAHAASSLKLPSEPKGLLARIRLAQKGGDQLRMVFDLTKVVQVKNFILPPNRQYQHRLVIDLANASLRTEVPRKVVAKPPAAKATNQLPAARNSEPVALKTDSPARDLVIAIDAGHGGDDPGARGATGAREKDVVLAIAKKLAGIVNRERGMRAVLIREGDYYIGLRQRMNKARNHKADLFVSIHADAFPDSRASGSSVYVLSRHGASNEAARWLAERENEADLIGGVNLDAKDDLVKAVMLDMSQKSAMDASGKLAHSVLRSLNRIGRIHHTNVQRAAFMVLKSPDIPSILVETAFITNPIEERWLTNPRHQQVLAQGIMDGIKGYFRKAAPPPGTQLALSKESAVTAGANPIPQ
jgi:N-acetylmuramoyl-L-alanine amidase